MSIRYRWIPAYLLMLAWTAAPAAQAATTAERVEVFTNAGILLTGIQGATIYYVDGLAQLQQILSQGLPADQQSAADIVKRRAAAMGSNLQQRVINATDGIARATYYGIHRVPAIVFDERAVIFGVTDIELARSMYRRSPDYRAAHEGAH